jgi:predicted nucleotidyltransferase
MNIFLEAHIEVLKKLLEFNVEFILVGGYAVNFHGYNRVTGDIDLWIRPDNGNKLLLLKSLESLGFDKDGMDTIRNLDFNRPQLFSVLERPFQVEFMTHISGIKFDDAILHVIQARLDELTIPIIHFRDLIINKTSSGRTKDLVDVEYLNRIKNLKSNKQK